MSKLFILLVSELGITRYLLFYVPSPTYGIKILKRTNSARIELHASILDYTYKSYRKVTKQFEK